MLSDGVQSVPLKQFLKDEYGYKHDFLVIAAIVVPSFCVVFAVTFGYAIKSFNFQRRWRSLNLYKEDQDILSLLLTTFVGPVGCNHIYVWRIDKMYM